MLANWRSCTSMRNLDRICKTRDCWYWPPSVVNREYTVSSRTNYYTLYFGESNFAASSPSASIADKFKCIFRTSFVAIYINCLSDSNNPRDSSGYFISGMVQLNTDGLLTSCYMNKIDPNWCGEWSLWLRGEKLNCHGKIAASLCGLQQTYRLDGPDRIQDALKLAQSILP